jgi:predicted nucleic acid-binding protein
MIVVADTSPLNYLVLIGQIDVLKHLYGRILIPPAVLAELTRPQTPLPVKHWAEHRPDWLEVRPPRLSGAPLTPALGQGEAQAILLASETPGSKLIIDESLGRAEAQRLGLVVIGTVGVLRDASNAALLDLKSAVQALQATTFRVSPTILEKLLLGK